MRTCRIPADPVGGIAEQKTASIEICGEGDK